MLDRIIKMVLPALVFSFVCAAGWFCAWIGGVQPFTGLAGLIAFATLFVASCMAAGVSGVKL